MRQRGRKSAESLALNVIDGGFAGERPDPPGSLTQAQADIWKAVVRDEPLDFFATAATREMLKDFCVVREIANSQIEVMNSFPAEGRKSIKGQDFFRKVQASHDMAVRTCTTLATKLRMTNQSRYSKRVAAIASDNTQKGLKIWDWEQ